MNAMSSSGDSSKKKSVCAPHHFRKHNMASTPWQLFISVRDK